VTFSGILGGYIFLTTILPKETNHRNEAKANSKKAPSVNFIHAFLSRHGGYIIGNRS
jgi:hypothetical protein